MEKILHARLRLSEYALDHSLDELLTRTLDEAELLTGSTIGFFHFVEADQKTLTLQTWSTNTLRHMCTAGGKGRHYSADVAGVWVDALRERRPVVHNDYASLPNRHGLPPGHAPVLRELVVPVLRNERIVALVGLGNKPHVYKPEDVTSVSQLANLAWEIVRAKQAEMALRASEERHRAIVHTSMDGFWRVDLQGRLIEVNAAYCRMSGYSEPELLAMSIPDLSVVETAANTAAHMQKVISQGTDRFESRQRRKDGSTFDVEVSVQYFAANGGCVLVFLRDITERNRTEDALRASEQRFRAIASHTPDHVLMQDKDLRYRFVIKPQLGLTEADMLGKTDRDFLGKEDADKLTSIKRKVIETGAPVRLETSLQNAKGEADFFDGTLIPLFDATGKADGLIGYLRNVTERKKAESEVREAVRFTQATIDALSSHICVLDDTGRILAANKAWTAFGAANSHPTNPVTFGGNYFDVCREVSGNETADASAFLTGMLAVLHGESSTFEMEYPCHSPTEQRWFVARVTRFAGPGPVRLVVEHENITMRKQAVAALSESDEKFRQLANNITDVFWITSSDFKIIYYVSPGYERIWGRSMADLYSQPHQWAEAILPQERERVRTALAGLFGNEPAVSVEYRIARPDGSVRLISDRAFQVRDAAGKVIRLTGIASDITEQQQLVALNQQLQKSESLGRMAGAIAHRFNNQLQALMLNLEVATNNLTAKGGPVEGLIQAMQSARNAAEVSTLMLTYIGQAQVKDAPLDLAEVCRQSLALLRSALPPEVVLETDLPTPGPIISANANQVRQVLTNLITNAWEASGEGRGAIRLSVKTVSVADIPAACRFPINWKPQSNATAYACLEVADAGCGIAAKDFDKLFEPFFSTKFTGRGLGLPVVLGIARSHDGVVTVESELSKGSTFRIFIPVSAGALPQKPVLVPVSPIPKSVRRGAAVLVVEDEPIVRTTLALVLECSGFSVLKAEDGVAAVELFRQHRDEIGCVVCDLTMPRMNGWETLTAMRQLAPGIGVILASGYSEDQATAGDHPERPQAFLQKPYEAKVLINAINRILTHSNA